MSSDFYSQVDQGICDAISAFGITFQWRNYIIPCVRESSEVYSKLIDGGFSDTQNPSITVLRSDLAAISPGQTFEQSEQIIIDGQTVIIQSIVDDAEDPSITLHLVGQTQ